MKLISTTELAERLDVPETTLAQWRYRGLGPDYVKIGRHVRYDPACVDAWLASQTIKAGHHA